MLQDVDFEWQNGYISSASNKLYVPGQFLCTPTVVAPGSQTSYTNSTDTIAAVSSGTVWTGNYIAPPSGSVLVSASYAFKGSVAADVYVVGLCATGTVTPILGYTDSFQGLVISDTHMVESKFVINGLTAGTTYAQDLVFAANTGEIFIVAYGQASTTPSGSAGAPIIMTVQAI